MRARYRLKSPFGITIECDVPTPNGRCLPWCNATVEEKANYTSALNHDAKGPH